MYGKSLVTKAFEIKYKNKLLMSSSHITIEEGSTLQIITKSVHLTPSSITSFTISTTEDLNKMIELLVNNSFSGIKEIQIRTKLEIGVVVNALCHTCIKELTLVIFYLIAKDYLEINYSDIEPLFKYHNFMNLKQLYIMYSSPKQYYHQLYTNATIPLFEYDHSLLQKRMECNSLSVSYLNDHLFVISQKQEKGLLLRNYKNVFGRRTCFWNKNEMVNTVAYGGNDYEMNVNFDANYTSLIYSLITVVLFYPYYHRVLHALESVLLLIHLVLRLAKQC